MNFGDVMRCLPAPGTRGTNMAGHHEDLKRAIRAARSNAGINSDQELALQAGVHLQTLQNWMYGKTTPRPSEFSKVAQTLGVPMADFMAIYEGRDPEPPPLQDAIRELVDELRQDRRVMTALLDLLVRRIA